MGVIRLILGFLRAFLLPRAVSLENSVRVMDKELRVFLRRGSRSFRLTEPN